MPTNAARMARKMTVPLETPKEPNKPLEKCIQLIWLEFSHDRSVKAIPADDFEFLESRFNADTIIAAKKALYIHSVQEKGCWWWTRPRYTAKVAIEKVAQTETSRALKRNKRKMQSGSVTTLARIMTINKFVMFNHDALDVMIKQELYSRCSVMHAKTLLGIPTIKQEKITRWVWPAPVVQKWLLNRLSEGPVTPEELFLAARHEKDWEPVLISTAKISLPRVHIVRSDTSGIVRWADSLQLAKQQSGRIVSVDFDEVDDQKDEFEEEPETITVNGMKILKVEGL